MLDVASDCYLIHVSHIHMEIRALIVDSVGVVGAKEKKKWEENREKEEGTTD